MKYNISKVVICCLVLCSASSVRAASFDCQQASTAVEKMICASPLVSKADDVLARVYQQVMKSNVVAGSQLRQKQRAWLKQRNHCSDIACLAEQYYNRLVSLSDLLPKAVPSPQWLGEWHGAHDTVHETGDLVISNATLAGFEFSLFQMNGAHFGEVSGKAFFLNDNEAFYFNKDSLDDTDEGFYVTFKKTHDGSLSFEANNRTYGAGAGVVYDDAFQRQQPNAVNAENHFVKMGIFDNYKQLYFFKKLVGKDYKQFEHSFHLISKEDDLDAMQAVVYSGFLRGIAPLYSAIIMRTPDNIFFAAVTDENSGNINYFTNDKRFKQKLPKTIKVWSEGFAHKKIVFMSKSL